MYLHGMSSGDFVPALGEFFGSEAGLSASVITRLTTSWQEERQRFSKRSLAEVDCVYVWVDGIVRHEAPLDRVGGKDPPVACRSRPLKLRAA
jgi:transposase-like protein